MLSWVVTGYPPIASRNSIDDMRAEEEGVVALDQTDRGATAVAKPPRRNFEVAGSGEAAKAVGRSVASSLLARADEVIE
jgi:hypothetical protein